MTIEARSLEKIVGKQDKCDRISPQAKDQFQPEPFVDAEVAANFVMVKRKTMLEWARTGAVSAHKFGRGKRVVWRFRLSELASHDG